MSTFILPEKEEKKEEKKSNGKDTAPEPVKSSGKEKAKAAPLTKRAQAQRETEEHHVSFCTCPRAAVLS
jgi:hypothetical protein